MSPRYHTVMPGEQLPDIAREYYGLDTERWQLFIWHHNREAIPNPNHVYAGQRLVIPYA